MTLPSALSALAAAGHIRSPWLPGMRFQCAAHPLASTDFFRCTEDDDRDDLLDEEDWTIDLTDPATLGCLLALVREASGHLRVFCSKDANGFWWVWKDDSTFNVLVRVEGQYTEGAALSAALVALAEGS